MQPDMDRRSSSRPSREILVLKSAIEEIKGHFVDFSVEKGGILPREDDAISRFVPIPNEDPPQRNYVPSFERINEISGSLGEDLCFCGIVHNHISSSTGYGANRPSKEDKAFFASFVKENKRLSMLFFILLPGKSAVFPSLGIFSTRIYSRRKRLSSNNLVFLFGATKLVSAKLLWSTAKVGVKQNGFCYAIMTFCRLFSKAQKP